MTRERISNGFPPDPLWFKDAVIYEAHVRAFMDSSGDGIGDFRGLTSRLDYLEYLGITAVWLLPFYPSPLRDDGYDIADYLAVHPDYGTLRDAKAFIKEAHRRGLRVITELVFNHTSDQHAWFKRARRARHGTPERDWYVWNDTPDRYRDVRIIFKDFETSNWAWNPVANAYYWHRFYGHQPDLNYDNPKVHDAMLRITDFWLDAGVDGLRLDAIPYLYEREGTNGENLPETHAFLRKLRRHIDGRYADRMLLAEANQWPEDSVAYFGAGDECNMEFHFPLMPRMFMALRMEDRFPILDILAQTPAIPENAQWALFLRNHDELTLEMVTDEERDYMYRVYAADPQARINLGIRRRLAPLLGNNRRRIELMNGLMFSLPGTPVIYYGDEIGMGDNVYLGDRNGVRTPMQWSSDRNAGFSSANRQQLYLPVVTDPEYHYEAVNVETQQANPQSLYWWMKRLIALRKRHPAFGRGTLQFLQPDNRKILAFIREHEGETLLVVANLSRYAQWTELALEAWEGRVPVELFGSTKFPRIAATPWLVNLGPHAFLWFSLTSDVLTDSMTGGQAELPALRWKGTLTRLLDEADEAVAAILTDWMQARRWYRGKARTVRGSRLLDVVPLATKGHQSVLAFLQVEYLEDEPELYVLPLTVDLDGDLEPILFEAPQAAIAWLEDGQGKRARLVDGALVPETCEALLAIVARRTAVGGGRFDLQGRSDRSLRAAAGGSLASLSASPQRVEQSNSTAFFDERLILKLVRTVEGGLSPDVELTRYLSANGFGNVPPVLGTIDLRDTRARPAMDATLAMVQAYVANEGDLWGVMRDAADTYLDAAEAETRPPDLATDASVPLLELARREPPADAHRLIGASMETARVLGERIGQMHTILAAADPSDRDIAPETLTPFLVRSLYQGIRSGVRDSLALLASRKGTLSDPDQAVAADVLTATDAADRRLRRLLETRIGGQRIRVHGDLHLGQVLDTGNDVMIVDLEGEPARPLGERRLRKPALTDLAGMIRSFDYAAHAPLVGVSGARGRPVEAGSLPAWARFWSRWMSVACVGGYRAATVGAAFLPPDDDGWSVLLEALLIQKAAYELRYELGSRPDWVAIPLVGFRDLVAGA